MTLSIAEIIKALPEDENGPVDSQQALDQLLAGLAHKPVPVGSMARLWSIGGLQAKIALGYLAYYLRSSFVASDEKQRRLNETHLTAAVRVLSSMSYLRGAAMKIGQMLGNYPDVVPRQFADTLNQLHFNAPPMHYSLLREFFRGEMGDDPENIFASFETQAFAAASLGQVHRATLHSGERVAVKIQYPNIARTIRSDFRTLMAIMTPMRLSKDWGYIREQLQDICDTLQRETDYVQEAAMLKRSREAFGPQDDIVVPRVHEKYSSRGVLTMEYLDGVHLDEFLTTNPSQESRDRFGKLITVTSLRLYHTNRTCYADPHPGNYLFLSDGRLGLIDFGCCRVFNEQEWAFLQKQEKGLIEGSEVYRQALAEAIACNNPDDLSDEHMRLMDDLCQWVNHPLTVDGPFDFSDGDFMKRGFELFGEFPRKRYFRGIPVTTWLLRMFLGVRVMAYRLKAKINMKELYQQERKT